MKPGGFLLAYSGQYHLPAVYAALSGELEYVWTISIQGKGPKTLVHQRKIYSCWKPILIYCRPPYQAQKEWIDDLHRANGLPEKDLHDWQQPEIEALHYIAAFSMSGDLVIDPFLGSGTTAIAATKLGRRFTGCDIDMAAVETTLRRLNEQI